MKIVDLGSEREKLNTKRAEEEIQDLGKFLVHNLKEYVPKKILFIASTISSVSLEEINRKGALDGFFIKMINYVFTEFSNNASRLLPYYGTKEYIEELDKFLNEIIIEKCANAIEFLEEK